MAATSPRYPTHAPGKYSDLLEFLCLTDPLFPLNTPLEVQVFGYKLDIVFIPIGDLGEAVNTKFFQLAF